MPGMFRKHGEGYHGWSRVRKVVGWGMRAGRGQVIMFRTCQL